MSSSSTLGWRRSSHRHSSSSPHGARHHFKRQASEGPERRKVSGVASPRATLVRRVSVAPPAPTPSTKSFPADEASSRCLSPFSQAESISTLSRGNLRAMPSTGTCTRGITRLEEATIALRQALIRATASTPRVDPRMMMPQASIMHHGLATPTAMQPTQLEPRSNRLSRASNGLLNAAIEAPQSTPVSPSPFFEGPVRSSNNSVASAASTPLGHPRTLPSTPMGPMVAMPYAWRAPPKAVISPRPPYDISRPFGMSPVGGRGQPQHSPQASYIAPAGSNGSLNAPCTWEERMNGVSGGGWERSYAFGEAPLAEPLQPRACASPQMPRMPLRESDHRPFSPSFRTAVACKSDPELVSPGLRRMASASSTVRPPIHVLPKMAGSRVVATGSSPSRAPVPVVNASPPVRGQQATQSRQPIEVPNHPRAKREVSVPVNTLVRVQSELQDILSMFQRTRGGESLEKSLRKKIEDIEAEIHGLYGETNAEKEVSLKDEDETLVASTSQNPQSARPETVAIAGPADVAAGGPLGVRLVPVRCEEQTPYPMRPSGFVDDAICLPSESELQPHQPDISDTGSWQEEDKYIEVLVKKDGLQDRLGMDIRHGHAPGQLSIIRIEEASALDRANQQALAMDPPGETLQVGDFIVQVNDITVMEGGESHLVQELKENLELRIIVLRLQPSPRATPEYRSMAC